MVWAIWSHRCGLVISGVDGRVDESVGATSTKALRCVDTIVAVDVTVTETVSVISMSVLEVTTSVSVTVTSCT
jgi:hypothetical protein